MNEDFQNFVAYVGVSDTLIEQATKEKVAEVARVLTLPAPDSLSLGDGGQDAQPGSHLFEDQEHFVYAPLSVASP